MRIPSETVEELRASITSLDTEKVREAYRSGDFPRSDVVNDMDKRYRWDLLHASRFDVCSLYDRFGVNDTHIDTVLRKIVPTLRQERNGPMSTEHFYAEPEVCYCGQDHRPNRDRDTEAALDEWQRTGEQLSTMQARTIAGWYHSGQSSAAYAFASSGHVVCGSDVVRDMFRDILMDAEAGRNKDAMIDYFVSRDEYESCDDEEGRS